MRLVGHVASLLTGIIIGVLIVADVVAEETTTTGYIWVPPEPGPSIALHFRYEGGPMEIRTTHEPQRLIGMIDTAGNLMLTGRVYVDWDGEHPARKAP